MMVNNKDATRYFFVQDNDQFGVTIYNGEITFLFDKEELYQALTAKRMQTIVCDLRVRTPTYHYKYVRHNYSGNYNIKEYCGYSITFKKNKNWVVMYINERKSKFKTWIKYYLYIKDVKKFVSRNLKGEVCRL